MDVRDDWQHYVSENQWQSTLRSQCQIDSHSTLTLTFRSRCGCCCVGMWTHLSTVSYGKRAILGDRVYLKGERKGRPSSLSICHSRLIAIPYSFSPPCGAARRSTTTNLPSSLAFSFCQLLALRPRYVLQRRLYWKWHRRCAVTDLNTPSTPGSSGGQQRRGDGTLC